MACTSEDCIVCFFSIRFHLPLVTNLSAFLDFGIELDVTFEVEEVGIFFDILAKLLMGEEMRISCRIEREVGKSGCITTAVQRDTFIHR